MYLSECEKPSSNIGFWQSRGAGGSLFYMSVGGHFPAAARTASSLRFQHYGTAGIVGIECNGTTDGRRFGLALSA
jgi:hypothetical protein